MVAYVELYLDQGTTFNNTINFYDDVINQPINVATYSFSSQMRRSFLSSNASANITCTITDAANGEVTLSMTSANTANIKPGRYLFDLEQTTDGGVVTRILEGIIYVTPEITR